MLSRWGLMMLYQSLEVNSEEIEIGLFLIKQEDTPRSHIEHNSNFIQRFPVYIYYNVIRIG